MLPVPQVLGQRFDHGLAGLFAEAERLGDRGRDELPVAHRRERDEEDAAVERLDHRCCDLEGEPGLSGAARPGERQQTCVVAREQLADLLELPRAADERIRLGREVGRPVAQRRQRREVGREALDDQLVEALRAGQVLEPMVAQVVHLEALVQQRPGGLREQHLPAVRGRHHPRGVVDVQPHVVAPDDARLAGVQAHPHPDLGVRRPGVLGERALALGGRSSRVARRGEHDEEGVALAAHVVAVVPFEGLAEQAPVLRQEVGVRVGTDALQQPGRRLDVAEQQGDRAARRFGHAASIALVNSVEAPRRAPVRLRAWCCRRALAR